MKILVLLLSVWVSLGSLFGTSQSEQCLPLGISTFSKIIKQECAYVDKTDQIYRLLTSDSRYFFIARPRQFGRTLFLTTLESLFAGEKTLFKKCAIANRDYSWQRSPVILLDFWGTALFNKQEFESYLCRYMQRIAERQNVDLSDEKTFVGRFKKMIVDLANHHGHHSIVLLVDEYDKPLLDRIDTCNQYKEIESVLKALYDAVGQCDNCWRFVFITGLTKCSKQNIFSEVSTLRDISEDKEYADLFGFSRQEVLDVLITKLHAYAQTRALSLDKVLDFMAMWCGGYNFSWVSSTALFNPRSVLYHVHDQKPDNYFFDGCTPSFLFKMLKQKKYSFDASPFVRVKKNNFEVYDQETMLSEVALYAAGYFTLCGFDEITQEYVLKIPNEETKQAFQLLQKFVTHGDRTLCKKDMRPARNLLMDLV